MNPRKLVIDALLQILQHGRSLNATEFARPAGLSEEDQALYKELLWGCLRHYFFLDFMLSRLVSRPLKRKDADVRMALILGLYQLEFMRTPDYAAVNESVALCTVLRKQWATAMVNAVLRNFLRQRDSLLVEAEKDLQAHHRMPDWLLGMLKKSWPDDWQSIALQSMQLPPMTLRVNRLQISREAYLEKLHAANIEAFAHPQVESAIELVQTVRVANLPGFADGMVSVQDASPQLAALLLNPAAGSRVLDACAAPGGKTVHLLEQSAGIMLQALDVSAERLQRVDENLRRAGLQAGLLCGDAAQPGQWWDGQLYDAILLDAPCSATGVIRRNPDIRYHRRADDIAVLCQLQRDILVAMWRLLKPGGRLLYATCSILPRENVRQMEWFCEQQVDALAITIQADWGIQQSVGRQVLSGQSNMDGFYYALLQKQPLA